MKDPSFKRVWSELKRFVQKKNRSLIFTLGNHDLELALPWVGEFLREKLTGGNDSASARLIFAFNRDGFRCKVGKSNVVCVHGNDVDTWNITDYEALRRLGRNFKTGQAEPWTPNAGTKLVIDVVNGIKSDYPFIDLLKPEDPVKLSAMLYALDPSLSVEALHAPAILARLAKDKVRRAFGFLADDDDKNRNDSAADGPVAHSATTSPADKLKVRASKIEAADQRLQISNSQFIQDCQPRDLLSGSDAESTLGKLSAFVSWACGRGKVEILREALESMGEFQGFDIKSLDDCFTKTDKRIGKSIDFVITGHTHQEKAICRSRGKGYYYNSGTWVRLMRLEPDVLNNPLRFREFFESIKAHTLKELDAVPDLVIRRPAVVSIERAGNFTRASLKRPRLKGNQIHLDTVERSQFERSK
jgi:UDP-2,3-diacylglucosamine pyrophosphatase LpxH